MKGHRAASVKISGVPEKYLANSPLFFADKIHTPLLILHNDQDGAVPWYQGIELFVAAKRLGRPAWMLNYNGEPHWVMDDYNRRDFAKRMQQFFRSLSARCTGTGVDGRRVFQRPKRARTLALNC